jgi:hypothetical protein
MTTLFVGAGARADVLIVNADGSADHTTIAAAVNAARDGDVILVQGTYSSTFEFVLVWKKHHADRGHPGAPTHGVAAHRRDPARALGGDPRLRPDGRDLQRTRGAGRR